MSTAGSAHKPVMGGYGPPAGTSGASANDTAPPRRRVAVFRWRGIIPLLLGLSLALIGWLVFGERVVRDTAAEASTKALGTQVDIASLAIDEVHTSLELRGVAIADPFNPRRNLIEANLLRLELEPEPLLEKKLVVRQLTLGDVRTGTARATPAKPVSGGGFAPSALREVDRWAKQFDVPLLSLTPIDTIKSIVLDPTQLASVQSAIALGRGADSLRGAMEQGFRALQLQETLDSSTALVARLQKTNLRTLGVAGARTAIADVRRAVARVDSVKRRLEALAVSAKTGVDSLQSGLRALDDARRRDYAFARGLLSLPSFDAPDMGAALFGKVTIAKFQQALYWTTLARKYAPPGLLPKESEGPKRMRRAGTTVHFVQPQSYPRLLVRRADVKLTIGDGAARGAYVFGLTDATTEPALVGRPTRFALRRTVTAGAIDSLHVTGVLDHTGARPRDVVVVQAGGVKLPALPLPVLPYRADPGRGMSEMRFSLDGDALSGRWSLSSANLSWLSDSARARPLNTIESLVARVLTGVRQLELAASMSGSVRSPSLSVSSNLDRVIADRLRAVAGEELAAAEKKVRARVDSLVEEKAAPVRARVAELRTEGERRVAEGRARLDAEKKKLEEQLKALTGGLVGLPKLP